MPKRELAEYRAKRKAAKTPEPVAGVEAATGEGRSFVVQRHSATRLHYDFRLERDGVLALVGGAQGAADPAGARRLAVHVEDHPLEYGGFEGVIPKGQYGGGVVDIYDAGTYEVESEHDDGRITFRLHGQRLEGRWSLVPAHMDGEERNWLLICREGAGGGTRSTRRCSPRSAPPCLRATPGCTRSSWTASACSPGWTTATCRCGRATGSTSPTGSAGWRSIWVAACAPSRAWSTARCAPWTSRACRGSSCSRTARARSSTTCSTCSRWRAQSYVGRTFDERRAELERLVDERAPDDPPVPRLRRRRRPAGADRRRRAGGHRLEAALVEVHRRPPQHGLAEGQAPRERRVRNRGLPAGPGPPQPPRLARAGGRGTAPT